MMRALPALAVALAIALANPADAEPPSLARATPDQEITPPTPRLVTVLQGTTRHYQVVAEPHGLMLHMTMRIAPEAYEQLGQLAQCARGCALIVYIVQVSAP